MLLPPVRNHSAADPNRSAISLVVSDATSTVAGQLHFRLPESVTSTAIPAAPTHELFAKRNPMRLVHSCSG